MEMGLLSRFSLLYKIRESRITSTNNRFASAAPSTVRTLSVYPCSHHGIRYEENLCHTLLDHSPRLRIRLSQTHLGRREAHHVRLGHPESCLVGWCVWVRPVMRMVNARKIEKGRLENIHTLRFLPRNMLSFRTRAWPTRLGSVNSTYAYLHHSISDPSLARQRQDSGRCWWWRRA